MWLNGQVPDDRDPTEWMAEQRDNEGRVRPFVAAERVGPARRENHSFWRWNCTKLGDDGRCMDYENRPDTCRLYEPRADGLCVHYTMESGAGDFSTFEGSLRLIDPLHETIDSFPGLAK